MMNCPLCENEMETQFNISGETKGVVGLHRFYAICRDCDLDFAIEEDGNAHWWKANKDDFEGKYLSPEEFARWIKLQSFQ